MHPSNRDHKDMQKGGVPNISSEGPCQGVWEGGVRVRLRWMGVWRGGLTKLKAKRGRDIPDPVPSHLKWRRAAFGCVFGRTKSDAQVRNSMRCVQIKSE